jgi:hypothetical protein
MSEEEEMKGRSREGRRKDITSLSLQKAHLSSWGDGEGISVPSEVSNSLL